MKTTTTKLFTELSKATGLLEQRHAARQERNAQKKDEAARVEAYAANESLLAGECERLAKENADLRSLLKTSAEQQANTAAKPATKSAAEISNLSKVEQSILMELQRNNLLSKSLKK